MTELDDLNARLERLGYHAEEIDHQTRPPVCVKPLGRREPLLRFRTIAEAATTFDRIGTTSQRWCLDLEAGNVDVDRESGIVTPRDGSEPFDLHNVGITEQTGASNNAPVGVPALDVRRAEHIVVSSQERPPLGGWWYLAPPK